ncbi:unnamed protein product [Cylicostephanus goldi]|uniref:SH2 domain-containing protein n=1 Tax=Cylicostephanus goldi TaxID=71465 RepID=A0A3P6TI04_CYLGO|nr:unnamed protein product [Cylicostephanus goldi]
MQGVNLIEEKKVKHRTRESEEKSEVKEEPTDRRPDKGEEHFDKEEEKILKEFDFYHGFLPREDLFLLVRHVGDYLLRVSEVRASAFHIELGVGQKRT